MLVTYPNLDNFSGGIAELMALPNASFPFYWTLIIVRLWVIFSFTMYFADKALKGESSLLSAMAVSSFAIIMLSTVGTLFNILTLQSFLPLLVAGLVIIAIWIFAS